MLMNLLFRTIITKISSLPLIFPPLNHLDIYVIERRKNVMFKIRKNERQDAGYILLAGPSSLITLESSSTVVRKSKSRRMMVRRSSYVNL